MKLPLPRIFAAISIGVYGAFILLMLQGYAVLFDGRSGLALQNGAILGGDFLAFYTGGSMLRGTSGELYSFTDQLAWQQQLGNTFGNELPFLPFVYPPFVAALFFLFSRLPFPVAYALWVAASLTMLSLAWLGVVRMFQSQRREVLWLGFVAIALYPLSISTIAGGQLGAVGVSVMTAVYLLLHREKWFLAGMTSALLLYKAPLFLLFLLGLLFREGSSYRRGLLFGGVALTVFSFALVGWSGADLYFRSLFTYLSGQVELLSSAVPEKLGVGSFAFLAQVVERNVAVLVNLGCVVLTAVALFFSRRLPRESFWAVTGVASVFFSYQVNYYDLSLLIPIVLPLFLQQGRAVRFALLVLCGVCFVNLDLHLSLGGGIELTTSTITLFSLLLLALQQCSAHVGSLAAHKA